MSFRKRSDVIGGGGPAPIRGPGSIPNRNPGAVPARGPVVPGRAPAVVSPPAAAVGRAGIGNVRMREASTPQRTASGSAKTDTHDTVTANHPGVKPSILTSQATVSTGSMDLDRILGHQGLPLGSSLIIEENGTTDFATVLLKKYAAEGIIQTRLDTPNTHVIVIGQDAGWGKSLPGLYKGSSRDQKKAKVVENESKLSVSNLTDQQNADPQAPKQSKDLKIAWRYGFLDRDKNSKEVDMMLATHPEFIHQFDITTTMVPAPNPTEISFVPVSTAAIVHKQVESIIQRHRDKLIRIVLPNLLHPLIYPLEVSSPAEILKLVNALRSLTKVHSANVTLASFVNLDLYPRGSPVVALIEKQFDCVLELKPFEPALYELMERVYQKEPKKIKHGFVNIIKLPVLSDFGMMLQKDMEYCFKNGKKNFEIEEWSIPVDEETAVDSHDGHSHHNETEITANGNPLKGQTKKDIEF